MAEVVKVPVLGNVKTPWLYAGGAAVAGVVGYAWWTRGGGSGTTTEDFAVELPATDYQPPTVVDSGINVGGAATGEPIARTNIEWASLAREQASALGYTQAATALALTKYFARQPLSTTESSLMRAVVQVLGQPPQGGPYTITDSGPEPPAPHETTGVTGLQWEPVGKNPPGHWGLQESYQGVIAWQPVAGATGYSVRARSGDAITESQPYHRAMALPPGSHTYYVRPVFTDGRIAEEASITFTVP